MFSNLKSVYGSTEPFLESLPGTEVSIDALLRKMPLKDYNRGEMLRNDAVYTNGKYLSDFAFRECFDLIDQVRTEEAPELLHKLKKEDAGRGK